VEIPLLLLGLGRRDFDFGYRLPLGDFRSLLLLVSLVGSGSDEKGHRSSSGLLAKRRAEVRQGENKRSKRPRREEGTQWERRVKK